jgi:hypothetical protein
MWALAPEVKTLAPLLAKALYQGMALTPEELFDRH